MSKRERLMFKVAKGALVPADNYTVTRIRERGLKIGDIVALEITKPRNPGFHRLGHQLGTLIAENVDVFTGMDSHDVIKRLQVESGIECDDVFADIPGLGPMVFKKPRSLSFESMDQTKFHEVMKTISRHVAKTYWSEMSEDQILEMADCMVNE